MFDVKGIVRSLGCVAMGSPFEISQQFDVAAGPEQVWDAVTTSEGLDGWFMGNNEVQPGAGGTVRTVHPGFTMESKIITWEPPSHFVHRSEESPDGGFHQFQYFIEPRESGSSVRWHHSGFLGGDGWEAEYEAMGEGDPAYFHKLAQYLTYFFGRKATVVDAFGPNVPDGERMWSTLRPALGLSDAVELDERVRLTPEGLEVIEGVVDYLSPSFLGVRTDDALYRFIHSFEGTAMVGHHIFSEGIDQKQAEEAWSSWMNRVLS